MKVIDEPLPGLKVIALQQHGDHRGFFAERYHQAKLAACGIDEIFVQDNHSRSAPGILRGLHYQHTPPQGKLVGVTRGEIWDVAVDIRPDSPSYGQYHGVTLSDENALMFWIPAGFAHGFCVTSPDTTDVLYKCSGLYDQQGEGGMMWNDPDLAIDWPVDRPVISARDEGQASFAQYRADPPAW